MIACITLEYWIAGRRMRAASKARHTGKGYAVETRTIGGVFMKSTVVKRSIAVAGHKTTVSLEDAFWNGLKEIVRKRHMTLAELVAEIDAQSAARQSVIGPSAFRARLLSRAASD